MLVSIISQSCAWRTENVFRHLSEFPKAIFQLNSKFNEIIIAKAKPDLILKIFSHYKDNMS